MTLNAKGGAGARPEMQLRRILVPIDFSEHSKKALHYAVAFARTHGAQLVLLHVLELPLYPVSFGVGPATIPPVSEDLRQAVNRHLETLRLDDVPSEIGSEALVREGRPFFEICVCAREVNADLIVIGTHGYSGVKHVLLGSTAEKVVRKAPCPVLTVRPEEREFVLP